MAFKVTYIGDGSTSRYTIPFTYLDRANVSITVDNVEALASHYSYLNDGEIEFTTPKIPPPNAPIVIERKTPSLPQVDFTSGSVVRETDLDTAHRQPMFAIEEVRGVIDDLINGALIAVATATGVTYTDPDEVLNALAIELIDRSAIQDFQTRIDDILANAEAILTTNVTITGLQTVVTNEIQARIDGDTASVTALALLGAVSGDSLSFILDLDTVRVSPTEALGTRFSALQSSIDTNTASIITEASTRATQDSVFAGLFTLLGAEAAGGGAFILDESTVQVNDVDGMTPVALATRMSGLDTRIGGNAADILTEQTARASGDAALASQLNIVQATYGQIFRQNGEPAAPPAKINDLWFETDNDNRLRVYDGFNWVALEDGRIAANEAAIATETTARVTADSALATQITNVTTTVGSNTATIASQATSINGLEARYGVTIDVNGHITGFIQNNDGQTGSFEIVANRFAVIDPGNGTAPPSVPFEIVGGVTRIQNAVILNPVSIDDGTVDSDWTMPGTITLDTLGHIKGGQTAYDTGAGFYLGWDTGIPGYVFSIGDGNANSLTWNGTTLRVRGDLQLNDYASGSLSILESTTTQTTSTSLTGNYETLKTFALTRSGVVSVAITRRSLGWSSLPSSVNNNPGIRLLQGATVLWEDTDISNEVSTTTTTQDVTVDLNDGQVITLQARNGIAVVSSFLEASRVEVSTVNFRINSYLREAIISD